MKIKIQMRFFRPALRLEITNKTQQTAFASLVGAPCHSEKRRIGWIHGPHTVSENFGSGL
jgi:hypothetical protein